MPLGKIFNKCYKAKQIFKPKGLFFFLIRLVWEKEKDRLIIFFLCPPHLSRSHVRSLQSCSPFWDLMDCSLPGSSANGISQTRILGWIAIPSSRGASQARDRTHVSCGFYIAGRFFTVEPPQKPIQQDTNIKFTETNRK